MRPVLLSGYNKYHNKRIVIDNVSFVSQKEGLRYTELKMLFKEGKIKNLLLQPEFVLQTGFYHKKSKKEYRPIIYRADFSYIEDNIHVVEDVKGMKTEVYLLKKKMFLLRYPFIDFREV